MERIASDWSVMVITAIAGFLRGTRNAYALLVLITLAIISTPLLAVDCTPDSITLSSQSQVDSFQADHGPCDTIVGVLTISGGNIDDLSPLSGITTATFGSTILIQNNTVLTNLDGLSGLTSGRWFEINNNPALASISGLSSLESLTGPLFIQGNSSLTNLDGLEGLTNLLLGALSLGGNENLGDLSGLSNLTRIGAALVIDNNDALTNLADLSALSTVGSNISIIDNDSLVSISGLSGVSDFSAGLNIIRNLALSSLDGLPTVVTLNSLNIQQNPALVDLDGLSGLAAIGTGGSALFLDNNAMLENLDGLAELISLDADLEITRNPKLSQCSGLATLLDQFDDALPGPGPGAAGIPDINGEVFLSDNLGGCNSVEDILASTPLPPLPANFIAGEAEFLFKGFGVTGGCLESMIRLPGPMTFQSREMLLECSMQDYAEDEMLVFRAADKSCRTLRARNPGSAPYEFPVHAPYTPYSGSLEEVSDAMFLEDGSALLALNLRTSEIIRVGTLACVLTGFEELIFADGFE